MRVNHVKMVRRVIRMNFDDFRASVMNDPALLQKLLACETESALFDAVQTAGHERGLDLSEFDFSSIVNANRRRWLERWLYQ